MLTCHDLLVATFSRKAGIQNPATKRNMKAFLWLNSVITLFLKSAVSEAQHFTWFEIRAEVSDWKTAAGQKNRLCLGPLC